LLPMPFSETEAGTSGGKPEHSNGTVPS
jgi:hypothetical protein